MVKKRRPHDEVRPAVVAAALEAIAKGGLPALSARGLASAVDISVGTIYNLFGDLDGVIRAVNLDTLHRMYQQFTTAVDGAGEKPEARLIALADAYLDFARAAPHRWQALFQYRFAMLGDDDRVGTAEADLFALLSRAAKGTGTPDALRALWAAVHGVVDLTVSERLRGMTRMDARKYVHLIIRAGVRGFAALEGEPEAKRAAP